MKASAELYRAYAETKKLIVEYPDMQAAFRDVETLFEDKKASPELSVMVYGIYNAGKSTLINALVGSDVAPTGDVPLTADVKAYQWNNFSILDTPGVDAPLAHEQVTQAQMMLADAVIFVVNPSGAAEEEKTLGQLIDLIYKRKKVFLVFNEKSPLSQEDFIRLKNDTRARLQSLAVAQGLSEILTDIPILRINAASALKGKLAKQQGLVEHSGIIELESSLNSFFSFISPEDVNSRLAHSLQVFLNQFIQQLTNADSNELLSHYQELCRKLIANQGQCRDNIYREIASNRKHITVKSKAAMHQHPEGCLAVLEQVFEDSGKAVVAVMDDELQYLMNQFNDDVETMSAVLNAQHEGPSINDVPHFSASESKDPNNQRGINKEVLGNAASSVVKMAKPEHIVGGLKLVKDWAPSLMKGIGPKTMEKWAGQVIGKWIPYVGTGISVISSIYDLFSEDPTDKQMREHETKVQQERERFEQQVEDTANDLGEQFERAMNQILRHELELVLQQMLAKVESAQTSANEQEKANSDGLMRAQTLLTTI
ncbi:GTPase [Shewanella frigidimarina]|uniref:GTPase n=1 Tax=Shewanella frigidimarina TaxID=56812 RepID=UPI003D7A4777